MARRVTMKEVAQIRRLAADGATMEECARRMGRAIGTIRVMARRFNIRFRYVRPPVTRADAILAEARLRGLMAALRPERQPRAAAPTNSEQN